MLPGTYTQGFPVSGPLPGGGSLLIEGDPVTPANVVLQTAGDGIDINAGAVVALSGITFLCTGRAIAAFDGGTASLAGALVFGAGGTHLAADNGTIERAASYTISGAAGSHLSAANRGVIKAATAITVTVTGTPAFSTYFAIANDGKIAESGVVTYVGSGTGIKANANLNGVIDTAGAGGANFPGSSAPTTSTGGQIN
jgi:hypothetical protein